MAQAVIYCLLPGLKTGQKYAAETLPASEGHVSRSCCGAWPCMAPDRLAQATIDRVPAPTILVTAVTDHRAEEPSDPHDIRAQTI